MSRSLKVIFAVVFAGAAIGVAGFAVIVLGRDPTTAGLWAAVAGVVVSALTGTASAMFGWAAWRHPLTRPPTWGVGVPGSRTTTIGDVSGSSQVVVGDHNRVQR